MDYNSWISLNLQIIDRLAEEDNNIEKALSTVFTPVKGISLTSQEIKDRIKTPNMIILKGRPKEYVSSLLYPNIFNDILYNQLEIGTLEFSNGLLQKWIMYTLTLQKEYELSEDITRVLKSVYGYISSTRVQSKVFALSKCESSEHSFTSTMATLRNLFLEDEVSVFMESRVMYFNNYIPTKVKAFLTSNNISFDISITNKSELEEHKNYIKRIKHLNRNVHGVQVH